MATTGNYYIDKNSFTTATSIYTDEALTTLAPDGYYKFGDNYRQQVGGVLLPNVKECPSCGPVIECEAIQESGGTGVFEAIINLDKPNGGVVVVEFDTSSTYPDKLEIIHNGTKFATSGQTVSNSGPFDDIYGDPTEPTNAQALAIDQFIGGSKGLPPTRESDILSETGIAFTVETGYMQLIWWQYDSADYSDSPFVTVRITSPYDVSTYWKFKRLCE